MIRFAAFLASNQRTKAWSIRGHRRRGGRSAPAHPTKAVGWGGGAKVQMEIVLTAIVSATRPVSWRTGTLA
jgi:hypothetical protein